MPHRLAARTLDTEHQCHSEFMLTFRAVSTLWIFLAIWLIFSKHLIFCLCSGFQRHKDRHTSREVESIVPCRNCALSCVRSIRLLAQKPNPRIWHALPAAVVEADSVGLSVLWCAVYPHCAGTSTASLIFVERHQRETCSAEPRGGGVFVGIAAPVASFRGAFSFGRGCAGRAQCLPSGGVKPEPRA